MGRPLNKRLFAKADVGPTVAGNEIQVHFFNDGDELEATFAEGFIVKQRGTRKFVVSSTGTDDTTYDCVLVAGVEPQELTTGQMLIFVKADDDEVYTVSKITGHKATLVKNAVGNNIYDGKSVPWNFSADLTDGYVQIEEAGDNDVLDGSETDVAESSPEPDPEPEPPAKITGVTSEVLSSSSIRINFTAPGDNGSAITGYMVYMNGFEHGNFVGSVPPLTITGLNASTSYSIHVKAVNSMGSGQLSDAIFASTDAEAEG
jgi:hypothetical protein